MQKLICSIIMLGMLIAYMVFLCSCAPTFFGATRMGDYHKYFYDQIECAYVAGWDVDVNKSMCMCRMTDPAFSVDKSFINMSNPWCEGIKVIDRD